MRKGNSSEPISELWREKASKDTSGRQTHDNKRRSKRQQNNATTKDAQNRPTQRPQGAKTRRQHTSHTRQHTPHALVVQRGPPVGPAPLVHPLQPPVCRVQTTVTRHTEESGSAEQRAAVAAAVLGSEWANAAITPAHTQRDTQLPYTEHTHTHTHTHTQRQLAKTRRQSVGDGRERVRGRVMVGGSGRGGTECVDCGHQLTTTSGVVK